MFGFDLYFPKVLLFVVLYWNILVLLVQLSLSCSEPPPPPCALSLLSHRGVGSFEALVFDQQGHTSVPLRIYYVFVWIAYIIDIQLCSLHRLLRLVFLSNCFVQKFHKAV